MHIFCDFYQQLASSPVFDINIVLHKFEAKLNRMLTSWKMIVKKSSLANFHEYMYIKIKIKISCLCLEFFDLSKLFSICQTPNTLQYFFLSKRYFPRFPIRSALLLDQLQHLKKYQKILVQSNIFFSLVST